MKRLIDLHIHSNLSDGDLSPKEIIDRAGLGVYGNLHYKFPHRYSQGKETCRYFSKDTIFSFGTVFFTSYEAAGKLFQ